MVAAEDDDEVDPAFRENVARVPVKHFRSRLLHDLELVQQLRKPIRSESVHDLRVARETIGGKNEGELTLSSSTSQLCHSSL